ncbi:MAG: hypothetical protein ABIE47_12925 [Pseudomonadota bacterium]
MGKTQKSKRAREARKAAVFAGLRPNTGHPSHLKDRNLRAAARLWERRYA